MPKRLQDTKHYKLAQTLRRQIRKMSPGEPLPAVSELKRRYHISQATVERALARLRRDGLLHRPAGRLRLIVTEHGDPAVQRVSIIRPDYPSPTFEELARAISSGGRRRDWAFDTTNYRSMEKLDLRRALGDNDGAVFLPTSEPFPEHLQAALARPDRPVIVIQNPPAGLGVSSVRIDDRQVGRLAVQHLARLGHRRILLVLSEPLAPSGRQRAAGWRKQLEMLGETRLDELVVDSHCEPFSNTIVACYEYFANWLDKPHPPFTGVFCAAWTGAVAVMRVFRERGVSLPEHVSLVAHGGEGHIGPFLNPPLSAVETDIEQYGDVVADLLERRIGKPAGAPEHLRVESTIVPRGTTAPRPQQPL